MPLLGVNIDHVATVRNARGCRYPDPVEAALIAEAHGADGITAHLREDRRHMTDEDLFRLRAQIQTRLNMEMANTAEMVTIALNVKPEMVTLVPERRQEVTTEGGLDVVTHETSLRKTLETLMEAGIQVSFFIDPDEAQLAASHAMGCPVVEFHTGPYCEAFEKGHYQGELGRLMASAQWAHEAGIIVNAGHGLHYENVPPILAMAGLCELNIGHSLIAHAIFKGLGPAVQQMKALIR